ncbi:uncharacterized protein LOC110191503 [Drosophila serrata]|uniref:uncharacterized protein LOC110191503 n=1 Tax=Drosophila serrata TaxID=7274 RepID=UPI000A1D2326|nr:uncharacterized protein LOC110191503 [Drosophila serrata]KAH8390395.1 hypothetical protein KR200_006535 [Drosophila serrata]
MNLFGLSQTLFTIYLLQLLINCTYSRLNLKYAILKQTQPSNSQNDTFAYRQRTKYDVQKTMRVIFYTNNTKTVEASALDDKYDLKGSDCSTSDKFAIVLHGWIQSCSDEWAISLIERLSYYRGGCVICIDYSVVASSSYMRLYTNFDTLTGAIASIILTLIKQGFDPKRGYMFGFSFGGQLASAVGRSLWPHHVIQSIDTCDMAGPGFDPIAVDHSKAGRHVQCFHSSRDKGTFVYSCHRNIMLGSCGLKQPSVASQLHLGSHGLCVDIYINTFDYPFYALNATPSECWSLQKAAKIPDGYTVGYEENYDSQITGQIFVPTSLHYPYNLSKKELLRILTKK